MQSNFYQTRKQVVVATLIAAVAASFFSCTTAPNRPAAVSPPAVSTAPTTQILGAHWIHNQALKQVMAQLITQNPSWPSRMPQEPESNKVATDRGGFLAEAKVLHDQAQRLAVAARLHRIEQMQLHMTSINSTCISCHSRYRDFSGQLDSSYAVSSMGSQPK
jgi:cytochrome c556